MLTLLIFLLFIPCNLVGMESDTSNEAWFAAAAEGDTDTLDRLLYDGHNINAKTPTYSHSCSAGSTALHIAAENDHTETVTWLIDHGVKEHGLDLNAADKYGNTPLHRASWRGHTEIVAYLVDHGADLNAADNNGYTPLHTAARWGRTETVACLADHGADLNATNNNGETPLLILSDLP